MEILYGGKVNLVAEIGAATTVALLIGIPLLVMVIVMAAVLGPQWSRAGRWRPGEPWQGEPMWFGRRGGEVPDGVAAITQGAASQSADEAPGGAHGRW